MEGVEVEEVEGVEAVTVTFVVDFGGALSEEELELIERSEPGIRGVDNEEEAEEGP